MPPTTKEPATKREHVQTTCANLRSAPLGSTTNGVLRRVVVLLQEQIDELRVEVEHLKGKKQGRRKKG